MKYPDIMILDEATSNLDMERGEIIEAGKHDELIRGDPKYKAYLEANS